MNAFVTAAAAFIDAPGAEPRLGQLVLPSRATGTTLVEVLAAPLNPLDLAIASGSFHSMRHAAAYVPGSECVGTVLASDLHAPGTLVYGECHASPSHPGALATHLLIDDDHLLVLPAGLDPVLAAAVGNAGVAAYLPLVERAALMPGERVLILGATGAVGQLAIQIARLKGAGKVVGVGRNPQALEHLRELGADATVGLRLDDSAEALTQRLEAAIGAADVILDGLYGAPLESALQVCAPGARVVNIGNMAGPTAQLPAGLLRGKQITVTGFAGLHTPLADKEPALRWLWSALAAGDLHVEVQTRPLDQLPEAWSAQAASPHAKCVLLPGDRPDRHTTPARRDVPATLGSEK